MFPSRPSNCTRHRGDIIDIWIEDMCTIFVGWIWIEGQNPFFLSFDCLRRRANERMDECMDGSADDILVLYLEFTYNTPFRF